MDNQTKIDTLKIAIEDRIYYCIEMKFDVDLDTQIINMRQWLQELEQSNNKDNIDNWTNRELFDYCVENGLCSSEHPYETWNSKVGRDFMISFISTFKSQK
jgi:hypothetical protein